MYNTHTDTQAAQQLEMQIQRCRRTQKKFQIRCRFVPVRQFEIMVVIYIRESKQCFTFHVEQNKRPFCDRLLKTRKTRRITSCLFQFARMQHTLRRVYLLL